MRQWLKKIVRNVTCFYNHTILYLNITSKSKVFLISDWFYLKHPECWQIPLQPPLPPTHTHTHKTIQFVVKNQIEWNLPLNKIWRNCSCKRLRRVHGAKTFALQFCQGLCTIITSTPLTGSNSNLLLYVRPPSPSKVKIKWSYCWNYEQRIRFNQALLTTA